MANKYYVVKSKNKSKDIYNCKEMIDNFIYTINIYQCSYQRIIGADYLFMIKTNGKNIGFISAYSEDDKRILSLDLCLKKKFRDSGNTAIFNTLLMRAVKMITEDDNYKGQYILIDPGKSHVDITVGKKAKNVILLQDREEEFLLDYPNGINVVYKVIGVNTLYTRKNEELKK